MSDNRYYVNHESSPELRLRRASLTRSLGEVLACARQTPQWLSITLDYARLSPLHYPYNLRLRTGDRINLLEHTDTIVFWLVFARQHCPVTASDRVILDIGASIGLFTLYAARLAPTARILAVEPFPGTCQRLAELIETNRLRDRVTLLNCAVAATAGAKTMDSASSIPSQYRRIHAPQTATLNASHRGSAATRQDDEGVPVLTQTLGDILNQAGVTEVDLMKMNIHGSEYDVLLSTDAAVLQRCKRIAVQYHEMPAEMGLGKEQIFERLKTIGFRLLRDDDTHRGSGRAVLARG